MAFEKRRHLQSELTMPVFALPHPSGGVGGKAKPFVIGGGDLADDAVDRADVDASPRSFGAVGEDRAGRMGMSQNERTARADCTADISGVVRALIGLPAACGRFHDDERSVGAKCRANGVITHGSISVISGISIAFRIALQNG